MPGPLCLYCEQRPATTEIDLCSECHARATIRALYRRGPHWTPQREKLLRRLAERAKKQLPLF